MKLFMRVTMVGLAASALATAACSGSDSGTPAGGTTANGGGHDGGGTIPGTGGGAGGGSDAGVVVVPDIDAGDSGVVVPDDLGAHAIGTYAERLVTVTSADLPILGKNVSTTTSYGLATIARDGTGLKITETGCHVDVVASANVGTTIPDAIPKSVPPTANPFRLWQDGTTVRFARIGAAVAIGAKLTNVDTDPLPTAATDARVWDQDGDGHPGVTVKITGVAAGDIYVVQRQKSSYEGTVAADGSMSGPLVDKSDQSVVGASNPLLNSNVATTPDPTKDTVKLVKVAATMDCAALVAGVGTIFN